MKEVKLYDVAPDVLDRMAHGGVFLFALFSRRRLEVDGRNGYIRFMIVWIIIN